MTSVALQELARAKINLTLTVLGKRPDGYHEIESLVAFADVADVVTLEPGVKGGVVVAGPFAGYIGGENLLIRALALLQRADPGLLLGSVRLDKHLPVAAGLGGGSADAAALLRAVQRANPDRVASVPWGDIARQLGADVPVCLGSRPALMSGVGERIAPVISLPAVSVILVNPRVPLATADVFASLGAAGLSGPPRKTMAPQLGELAQLVEYMRERGNDLQRPAIELLPVIRDVKAALEAEPECRLAALSGSGPTCFGIFPGKEYARRAAARISTIHTDWWVKPAQLQGQPAA
jgi:4-diphosphocytidyl-2-C-methyl-D-erythritol kinase